MKEKGRRKEREGERERERERRRKVEGEGERKGEKLLSDRKSTEKKRGFKRERSADRQFAEPVDLLLKV